MDTAADHWRTQLRTQLLAARKDRDPIRVPALRSALSAIDNAETPDDAADVCTPLSDSVAGAVSGLGAAEVPRRQLADPEIRALIRAEIDERVEAAEAFATAGHHDRAESVRSEAAVLVALLDDV